MAGGVETAFLSTSVNREVALDYATGNRQSAGIVFEIQQGMVDRGADLSRLSQYPHEEEILFAPLTSLEVRSTYVDTHALVVRMNLNINLTAMTIEKVVAKMQSCTSSCSSRSRRICRRGRAAARVATLDSLRMPRMGTRVVQLDLELLDNDEREHQMSSPY